MQWLGISFQKYGSDKAIQKSLMGSVENICYTKYAKNIRQIKKRLKENPKIVMKDYISGSKIWILSTNYVTSWIIWYVRTLS